MRGKNLIQKIFFFYYDGFASMTVGKKLWIIIFIKLFIMFAILKLFFFPDILKTRFSNDVERGNYVIDQITQTKNLNND
jgi:hypothetical protein